MMKLCALLLVSALLGSCQSVSRTEDQTAHKAASAPCSPPAPYQVKHPTWLAHSSIYEVNVRQYTPEGTFRAFEQHLPRLAKMGIGILWLMPVNPIGEMHRKGSLGSQYSVRDYRAVNPELGTLADLKHLVAEAHRRGMHVILDWVGNHSSWDNVLLSEHPDWYTQDAHGLPHPPAPDWHDVLDLDYSKPGLRDYMTASMAYWVKTTDIDGFRCDVAGLVPTDFWRDARRELEKIKPVFLVADWDELFTYDFLPKEQLNPNPRLLEEAFDAAFAFREHLLFDSLAQGTKPVAALAAYLAAERRKYPVGTVLLNFTSSHDVNSWNGSETERLGANARPLAVLAALLPGLPMVYSGQEAAQPKALRFFEKDTIKWNGYPLQDFYTRLLQLHKRHPALAVGDACGQMTPLPSPASVFTFVRHKDEDAVLVSVNLGAKPQEVAVPSAWRANYADLFAGPGSPLKVESTLIVPPHGYRVLERSRSR
jgi:glycosidase